MLMFLPGLICDSRAFAAQTAEFPDALALDGYGLADSLGEMARFVLAEADARGANELDLFGHSMGGRVAMEVFRLAPERVRRIGLASTGNLPASPKEAEKRGQLQQLGYERGFAALIAKWLPPMVSDANRGTALAEAMEEMFLDAGQAVFDAQVKALLARPPFEDLLGELEIPTLVMTGENDLWAPPAEHQAMAGRASYAKLVIVPGGGHMLPMEQADAVNAAIAEWLASPARD